MCLSEMSITGFIQGRRREAFAGPTDALRAMTVEVKE
jgi:hypothetical protein